LVVGAVLARAVAASRTQSHGPLRVAVGNLDAKRDFIGVDDVIEGLLRMIPSEAPDGIFNLCTGQTTAIRDILTRLFAHSRRRIELTVVPELVRPVEVAVLAGSGERAARELGFRPVASLDDVLRRTYEAAFTTQTPVLE
jgi:GDP-4-dehydro-6-deoxy-D-mannose reductase